MPYVATSRMPASLARSLSDASTGPPPTRTAASLVSATASSAESSHRCSWVGTSDRKPSAITTSLGARSPSSTGRWPATSERTTTFRPATYDDGSASTHGPDPPSRAADAFAEASTASRESTTCFGVPEEPEVVTTAGPGSSASSHVATRSTSRSASPVGRRSMRRTLVVLVQSPACPLGRSLG